MKKGKSRTLLAAAALGALTYLAWLGLDIKHSEKPVPVSGPYEATADTVAPVMPAPVPEPPRPAKRRLVKLEKTQVAAAAAAADEDSSRLEKKSPAEVPMPKAWDGTFVRHDRPYKKFACDMDYPCTPRGRDGVLLVGVSFSLNGWKPMQPEVLAVGAYQERTPLFVYK